MTRTCSRLLTLVTLVLCPLALARGGDETERSEHLHHAAGARLPADFVAQAGTQLTLLGLTDDDWALYQAGSVVYAAPVRAQGASAQKVGDVPGGNTAFVYVAGKVAFVWTNPNYASPSYGVSPLVIWTARHGAHFAGASSPVGTLTTASDDSGEHVIFPMNADAANTVADIMVASADLRWSRRLLEQVQADYANGPCRPLATFFGHGWAQSPVVAACHGADPTSTLSTWPFGFQKDLPGLTNPPRLARNPEGTALYAARAGVNPARGTPLLVTQWGVRELEDTQASFGQFDADGSLVYANRSPATAARPALTRVTFEHGVAVKQVLPSLLTVVGNGFGSAAVNASIASADSRLLAYGDAFDPSLGLTNLNLVELRGRSAGSTRQVVATPEIFAVMPGSPFTADSRQVVYARLTNGNTQQQFYASAVAGGPERAISDANAYTVLPATGSAVVFNDNLALDPTGTSLVGDLKVVDLASGAPARLLAAGAWAGIAVTKAGDLAVYTTDQGTAGLHVATTR